MAAREMQVLQLSHFADVSAGGTADRAVFCSVLCRFRVDAADGEVVVLHVFSDRLDDYRSACASASRRRELAGFCGWFVLLDVGAVERRHSILAECLRVPSNPSRLLPWTHRRTHWGGLWKPAAVGSGCTVQGRTPPRWHGAG